MKEKILEALGKSQKGVYTYRHLKLLLAIPDDEVSPQRVEFNEGLVALASEGKIKHFTHAGKTHVKLIRPNPRNCGRMKGDKLSTSIAFYPLPEVLEAYQAAEKKSDFLNRAVLAYIKK